MSLIRTLVVTGGILVRTDGTFRRERTFSKQWHVGDREDGRRSLVRPPPPPPWLQGAGSEVLPGLSVAAVTPGPLRRGVTGSWCGAHAGFKGGVSLCWSLRCPGAHVSIPGLGGGGRKWHIPSWISWGVSDKEYRNTCFLHIKPYVSMFVKYKRISYPLCRVRIKVCIPLPEARGFSEVPRWKPG